jgi:alcohol dehydrogenase class IV
MDFSFATATEIVFGRGTAKHLAARVLVFGSRPLIVTGRGAARHAWLFADFEARGTEVAHYLVQSEPTTDDVAAVVALGRDHRADVVLGLGGGSALDLAKAAAGLIAAPGEALDYLEVVGRGLPLPGPVLPSVLCPTTAGTGAEVTKNAVIDARAAQVKVSLRSSLLLPKLALVDPELTLSVPRDITAATGCDALVQVIEPFLSRLSNPLTDALCREGIRQGARALLRAVTDGSDIDARQGLCLTSLCGGLALANAKLGAVHGFAAPLGGLLHAPHGALCAALLASTLRVNHRALTTRAPDSPTLARLDELGGLLTGSPSARAEEAFAWCDATVRELGIRPLAAFGLRRAQLPDVVQKAKRASSMQGNPLALLDEELTEILERAL